MDTTTGRIEKQTVLRASRERVWRAITDAREFGLWFGVRFGGPFAAGAPMAGRVVPTTVDPEIAKAQESSAGAEFEITVVEIEPLRRFAFRWHPFAIDPNVDYSSEPTTLVVFELDDAPGGTRLTVTETGFDADPARAPRGRVRGQRRGMGRSDRSHREVLGAGTVTPHAVAPVFAALGDETRIAIVDRLAAHGPMSIVRLADGAHVSRQALTKHLGRLADAGLVRSERRGRERLWTVEPRRLDAVRAYVDRVSAHWDDALARLRTLVEEDERRGTDRG